MVIIKTPDDCTDEEKKKFIKLVEKGNEVDKASLPKLVNSAYLLAFSYIGDNLVGAGGIKRPYDSHRKGVFEKASSFLNHEEFEVELGWIYTEKKFRKRGIAKNITRELLGKVKDRKIYTTTRTDNKIRDMLKEFLFYESGEEYKSARGKYSLVLFVKD